MVASVATPAVCSRVAFRRQQVGALKGEQRLPALHAIADIDEDLDDAALVGARHLGREVLVEVDIADRRLDIAEIAAGDLADLDHLQLLFCQLQRRRPRFGFGGRVSAACSAGLPKGQ